MPVRSVVFFVCVAACVMAHAAILVAVARRPAGPARTGEPGLPWPRRGLEIVWAIVPAVALALVLTATWERVRETPPEPPGITTGAR